MVSRKIVVMLMGVALSGCASMTLMQPVAQQNFKNADALENNITTFFDADEAFFQAVVESQLIDSYREVIRSVQANDNPHSNDMTQIASYYTQEAAKLKDSLSSLSEESRAIEVTHFQSDRPLTAAVAFSDMLPMVAAAKWIGFDAIYRQPSSSKANKFVLMRKHFQDLAILEQKEQAARDLLQSYNERKTALLQQSKTGREIALQMLTATNTNTDTSGLLQSAMQNDRVVQGFDDYVLKKTGSPARKKAAEDLLKSLFMPK
ncbi:MAG: hypothetical protein PHI11_00900 [Gallionella sp.]|nr:hypothetical protein [Gallionella sp.]